MSRNRILPAVFSFGIAAIVALPAAAQQTDAATFLSEAGFTPEQIGQVQAGGFVDGTIQASTERELVAAFAFLVEESPGNIIKDLKTGLLDRADPGMLGFGVISGLPSPDLFAKLTLQPGAEQRAQEYVNAKPGGPLNLSSDEIKQLSALGSGAGVPAVEQAVRSALLSRLTAYRGKGLAGIASYARAEGKLRSPADELRSATQAGRQLKSRAPNAYRMLLEYPASMPPTAEEVYRWSHYIAHDTPTIALTHGVYVPEGDAWLVVQRQFYVSGGYNSEQAVGGLFPTPNGTVVYYTNRTSTDQVEGFGGGTKRSIGSKLLASQLRALYEKIQAQQKRGR
jgi:hypothetical protein